VTRRSAGSWILVYPGGLLLVVAITALLTADDVLVFCSSWKTIRTSAFSPCSMASSYAAFPQYFHLWLVAATNWRWNTAQNAGASNFGSITLSALVPAFLPPQCVVRLSPAASPTPNARIAGSISLLLWLVAVFVTRCWTHGVSGSVTGTYIWSPTMSCLSYPSFSLWNLFDHTKCHWYWRSFHLKCH
jgi:hypothetical protein